MKKANLLLVIEVQIILIMVIYLMIKNSEGYEVPNERSGIENEEDGLSDGEWELLKPFNDEIIIGNPNSSLRMVFYSRPDCKYCNEFFNETFPKLKKDYIDKGKVNLSIRYLTHLSKPKSLYATKCAYLAHEFDFIDAYLNFSTSVFPELDTLKFREFILESGVPEETFDAFIRDPEIEERIVSKADRARRLGINQTPTMYFGTKKSIGNRDYRKIKAMIEADLP